MSLFEERDSTYIYRRRPSSIIAVVIALASGLFLVPVAFLVFVMGKSSNEALFQGHTHMVLPIVVISIAVNALVIYYVTRRLLNMNSIEINQMERTITFFEQRYSGSGIPSRGRRKKLEIDLIEALTVATAIESVPDPFRSQRYSVNILVGGESRSLLRHSDRVHIDQFADELSTLTGLTIR